MGTDNLIGHGIFDYIIVFAFVFYAFYAGITKPQRILYIFPACLSFFFFIEVGPRLTPEKLAPVAFIAGIILNKGSGYFQISKVFSKYWSLKFLIIVTISFIIGMYYTNYYTGLIKSPFINSRLYVQIVGYVNAVLILAITRTEVSKENGMKILKGSFVTTTIILCLYGIYQHYAHQFGWPYRGIVYSASATGLGEFSDSEELIFRVNSFANEPKRLTYFLVIAILVLYQDKSRFQKYFGRIMFAVILIMHFVVLWLTYSTSIYISLAIFILLLGVYALFIRLNRMILGRIVLIAVFGISGYLYQSAYIQELYEARVEVQLDREEIRAEFKGQEYIEENPLRFFLGFGPGIYNFVLADYFPYGAGISADGKYLIPFNSGLLTYLFDFGIFGFILILLPLGRIFIYKNYQENEASVFIVFLYCTAITLNPTPTLFFFIGALEGLQIKNNEAELNK